MSKELSQRLTIAVIGIPLLLWVLYTGGIALRIALGLLTVIGTWEYRKMLFKDKPIWIVIDIIIALCVYLSASLVKEKLCPTCLIPSWATIAYFFALQSLVWFARLKGKPDLRNYMLTLWGLLYIAVIPGLIFRIDLTYHEQHLLLLLVILIWITDSAAYFIGMRFGKHRGIFPMSPKKSLEGFIAGFTAPILAVLLLFKYGSITSFTILLLTALSAGLFGQLGDLLESKLKRMSGVKDSSSIIPGHGGVLDRFDSLLLAGPVMYIMLLIS